jgi:glutathione S-transferase
MMHLIIGNKNYSSWSLRAWLPLAHLAIPFTEERIALFEPGYKERILAFSPAGKVPVLVDGAISIWESLAIGEYLAEKFPDCGLWPKDAGERAHARAICAEMHAGFSSLRAAMPMNIRSSYPGKGRSPEVDADIARACAIWQQCLQRSGGPFLYGGFGLADAMYAPLATRFLTYAVPLPALAQAYVDHLWNLPAMLRWRADSARESEVLIEDEPYL